MAKMKILDLNQDKFEVTPQVRKDAVNRILGVEPYPENELAVPVQCDRLTPYLVDLSQIKKRDVNEYRLGDIDKLMESIRKNGLFNPILIVNNHGDSKERYVICAGHRRYVAYARLYHQAKEENNQEEMELYSKIPCVILSDEEAAEREESIYRDSNEQARVITNFERIVALHPKEIDMSKSEIQKQYVALCYGEEGIRKYNNGELRVRGSQSDKARFITALIQERNPAVSISYSLTRKYLSFLDSCTDAVCQGVLNDDFTVNQGRTLVMLTPDKQDIAAKAAKKDLATGKPENEELFNALYAEADKIANAPVVRPAKTITPEVEIDSVKKIAKNAAKKLQSEIEKICYYNEMDEDQQSLVDSLKEAFSILDEIANSEEEN